MYFGKGGALLKLDRTSMLYGTLLLTATGLVNQLLGFFYRILLSRLIGSEVMGLYQLIMPVYSVLLSLTAVGLEPHVVLFCGDTVIDGEAARRAGTHFCAVLNGTTTFEEFQTRRIPCDHVAGDLWDLKQWLGLN